MSFLHRSESELAGMSDAQLVRYVADAKRAGSSDHAVTATFMLLYRHEQRIRRRVCLRIPAHLQHHADTVADWVLERITRSALKLPLRGDSVGEWVNWWKQAVTRQVISFWRSAEGKALEQETALPSEHQDDEARADTLGVELDVERLVARASYDEAIEAALSSLGERDQAIVRAAFWDDRSSKDVAGEFGTSANNVDQIKSRFRDTLRAECERRGLSEP